ncbi:MAG: apolipoprotein N-acyltransferase [Smithellaceae bacterium]|nr:apolipoprotein N-acyltransferase [Smithellaceae bacterium]
MIIEKTNRIRLFLSILSGALLFLSFPKHGHPLAAWIAFVPLFYALSNKPTAGEGFKYGFITGFVAYCGILYWIAYVVVTYGYMPVYMGVLALLLLASYLALYMGIFAYALVCLRRYGLRVIYTAPLIWVTLEYMKSTLLTGFPWANLGYSQFSFLPLIQISDITGVYGLSFLIVLVNAAIFELIVHRKERTRVLVEPVVVFVLLLSVIFYGTWRIAEINSILGRSPELPVTIVQGNIDQNVKWNPGYQQETIRIYKTLSHAAQPKRNGLIVWPETATPFYFQEQGSLSQDVLDVARATGSWLVFGSPSYRKEAKEVLYFNSAFLVSPAGIVAGEYSKVQLVPYGEYVPLRKYFPFLSKIVVGVGDFTKGPGYLPIQASWGKAGVLICYEGIFSHAGTAYKKLGASFLINITNDAWFGNTSAPYQHLSMSAFRAVENRVYLLRAANTGISAIIEPTGAIARQSKLFTPATVVGNVKYPSHATTFYASHGDIFAFLCISVMVMYVISIFVIGRRRGYDRRIQRDTGSHKKKDS